jgi:hypothetical protein
MREFEIILFQTQSLSIKLKAVLYQLIDRFRKDDATSKTTWDGARELGRRRRRVVNVKWFRFGKTT